MGFRFYYWDKYKELKEIPKEEIATSQRENYDAHSVYDVFDLFIERKCENFKEEMASYGQEFKKALEIQCAIAKAEKYSNSEKLRRIKAKKREHQQEPPYYNIKEGAALQMEHLLALLLYTDYTKHSASFSRSFRKKDAYESLASVRKRNSEYFWMSKRLREAVEYYGQRAKGDWNEQIASSNREMKLKSGDDGYAEPLEILSGPFYTGMSVVMTVPNFNIRLCSPTSTSTSIAVAMKFSREKGMILGLNNPKYNLRCCHLRGFDVSLVSRYSEEDERCVCFLNI